MLLNLTALILFISPFQSEEPAQTSEEIEKTPWQIAAFWLIDLHQHYLTHIDGPRSHFIPCSSVYMRKAITRYGFFKGALLGMDRLIRENSETWLYPQLALSDGEWIKKDPVP